jgi:outer membrane translocation and assembly module TamA
VGFGVRYNTPVGPVRFDIGRNLDPVTGFRATQFFVTLGQAF